MERIFFALETSSGIKYSQISSEKITVFLTKKREW